MEAAILDKYDKNGTTLAVRDVPTPKPAAHEVLARIHTSAVNPLDNMIIRGDVRLIVPYRTPLVMGNEFSGTVVQVGTAAVKFKPGDRVYGRMPLAKIGAFAEYAAIDEGALALVPSYLSMEEAACVPLTALAALQALDIMEAQPGQTLFVSGWYGQPWRHGDPHRRAHGPHRGDQRQRPERGGVVSYLTTGNSYVDVGGRRIAYRELAAGRSAGSSLLARRRVAAWGSIA